MSNKTINDHISINLGSPKHNMEYQPQAPHISGSLTAQNSFAQKGNGECRNVTHCTYLY